MHIRPPDRLIRATPPASRRSRRRQLALRWMVAGSLLLHLAVFALIWLLHRDQAPDDTVAATSDVAVVFQSAGKQEASTASPNPAPEPSTALGNPQGLPNPPTPTTATNPPSQAPAPPPQPVPPAPQAPQETPEQTPPAPQQEASLQPPQPETPPTPPAPAPPPVPQPPPPPPPAPPTPPAPKQPPTVSLDPSDEGEAPIVPQFIPPEPPAPLPPLTLPTPPRPPPRPRAFTQSVPKSSSGFPLPQNWSLATGPESLLSQRGTDVSSRSRGSKSDASYKHLAGADPGEDWAAELHRWASDHAYYPREAADNGEEGVATIQATINRYGKVLSVDLVDRSGSTFLDASWLGEWRNATVPRFPPGTPEDTTTILYTIHYILVRR